MREFGQLFWMAIDGPRLPADAAEFFRTFRIGGVILFADNYIDPPQLRALTGDLQRLGASSEMPLFIVTDHEGGRVQRFVQGFTRVPPMAQLGCGPPERTFSLHRRMARELREHGVNFNLAPVADLAGPADAGAIRDRSFGKNPEATARHVVAAVEGLLAEDMLCCVKHFPGHGATEVDSHHELPVATLGGQEVEHGLAPFRAAIGVRVPAVMTAHVVYPHAGDAEWPASLSEYWIGKVLRQDLGFRGLIVTDAIEMKSLSRQWSAEFCGYRALQAGADILLYYKEADQYRAFDELLRALEGGSLNPSRVSQSLERIRSAKKRFLRC